jgi:hypothetical protein
MLFITQKVPSKHKVGDLDMQENYPRLVILLRHVHKITREILYAGQPRCGDMHARTNGNVVPASR